MSPPREALVAEGLARHDVRARACMTDSIEQLLHEYAPAMRRLAASYLPPGPAREDLEQEIFLALYRGWPAFRGESSARTYVYRIGHHCALRALAAHKLASQSPLVEPLDQAAHVAYEHLSPEAQLLALEQRERLARALRALPLAWRQPLTMRLDGLSYQEIADALALELTQVTARLHRGTKALRALIERGEP